MSEMTHVHDHDGSDGVSDPVNDGTSGDSSGGDAV